MQRIAIDCRFWGPSHTGLGRYTESLVTAIYHQKPKFDIHLLINSKKKNLIHKQFPKFKLALCKSRPYSVSEQFEIPKILNQINPDLTHFLHFNVPIFYKQPFIVTIHDLIKHHSKGKETTTRTALAYPLKRLGYFLTVKHAVLNSQVILTPSNWVKKDILNFYPVNSKKITVTPEAAAPSYFKAIKSNRIPPKYPYLIYVGNAYPHKNLVQLIKVVKDIPIKLVIITGKDVFYKRLRKTIRDLNTQSVIKIKGFTKDANLKTLYQHSIAFITPSLFEGFGLPGLEAMASKTLVLSSNKPPLPQVYGKSAFYFDPQNPHDMATVIKKAINLKPVNRQAKIARGYQHAQSFSWKKTALKTLKVYEDCFSL